MIQLTYQPAFDAGHAIFRMLRLRNGLSIDTMEFEKLRILDFYLLFPYRAVAIRFKPSDLKLRSLAKLAEHQADYAALPSDRALFTRMEPAQIAAAQTMANRGAIAGKELRQGLIAFVPFALPAKLQERIETLNQKDNLPLQIVAPLATYALLGKDGIKDRTQLLEHRYDKV